MNSTNLKAKNGGIKRLLQEAKEINEEWEKALNGESNAGGDIWACPLEVS
jgi:hypothetical protein